MTLVVPLRASSLLQSHHHPALVTCRKVIITAFFVIVIIILTIAIITTLLFLLSPHWDPLSDPTVPPAPPRNLKVFNATTSSLTAKWDLVPGPVQGYRVKYKPASGGEPLTVRSHQKMLLKMTELLDNHKGMTINE